MVGKSKLTLASIANLLIVGCGPGINVDPPDRTGSAEPADPLLESGASTSSSNSEAEPSVSETPSADPKADDSLEGGAGPDPTAASEDDTALDHTSTTDPSSGGAGTGGSGGAGTGDSDDTGSSSNGGGGQSSTPPPIASVAPVPPHGPLPNGCKEPLLASTRSCQVAYDAGKTLIVDISEELQAFNADELLASPAQERDNEWVLVTSELSGSKQLELVLLWASAPATSETVRVVVTRSDDGCPVVEVPVQLLIGAIGNRCDPA
jgi:hypothetical protein